MATRSDLFLLFFCCRLTTRGRMPDIGVGSGSHRFVGQHSKKVVLFWFSTVIARNVVLNVSTGWIKNTVQNATKRTEVHWVMSERDFFIRMLHEDTYSFIHSFIYSVKSSWQKATVQ